MYEIFASQTVSQVVHELDENQRPETEVFCGMNYEDLELFYSTFKTKAEIDQVAFWIQKYKVTRSIFIQITNNQFDINQNDEENPNILAL